MYYVYVPLCESQDRKGKFYIGYCADLKERLARHKRKEIKTTKSFEKITLVYYEACLHKTDARKREIQLKTGFGRSYLNRGLSNYLSGYS